MNIGIQEFRNPGHQENRNSGKQEFRNPGIQEFRNTGIQESRHPGIEEFRNSGIQSSKSLSPLFAFFCSFRKQVALKLCQHLENVVQKASEIMQKAFEMRSQSHLGRIWRRSAFQKAQKCKGCKSLCAFGVDFGSQNRSKIDQT